MLIMLLVHDFLMIPLSKIIGRCKFSVANAVIMSKSFQYNRIFALVLKTI